MSHSASQQSPLWLGVPLSLASAVLFGGLDPIREAVAELNRSSSLGGAPLSRCGRRTCGQLDWPQSPWRWDLGSAVAADRYSLAGRRCRVRWCRRADAADAGARPDLG